MPDDKEGLTTEKIEEMLREIEPPTMTLEERLERTPGMILRLGNEIEDLSKGAEEAKRTVKTLEAKGFYKLKGTKNKKTDKPYTEAEAHHVAKQLLKEDSPLYKESRAKEQKFRKAISDRERLRDFFDRMERNAQYLVKLKALR